MYSVVLRQQAAVVGGGGGAVVVTKRGHGSCCRVGMALGWLSLKRRMIASGLQDRVKPLQNTFKTLSTLTLTLTLTLTTLNLYRAARLVLPE